MSRNIFPLITAGACLQVKKSLDKAIADFTEASVSTRTSSPPIRIAAKLLLTRRNTIRRRRFQQRDSSDAGRAPATSIAPWLASQKRIRQGDGRLPRSRAAGQQNAQACNNLAWLLATARCQIARRQRARTGEPGDGELDPDRADWYADTLAAAYAELCDFGEAIRPGSRACSTPSCRTKCGPCSAGWNAIAKSCRPGRNDMRIRP